MVQIPSNLLDSWTSGLFSCTHTNMRLDQLPALVNGLFFAYIDVPRLSGDRSIFECEKQTPTVVLCCASSKKLRIKIKGALCPGLGMTCFLYIFGATTNREGMHSSNLIPHTPTRTRGVALPNSVRPHQAEWSLFAQADQVAVVLGVPRCCNQI